MTNGRASCSVTWARRCLPPAEARHRVVGRRQKDSKSRSDMPAAAQSLRSVGHAPYISTQWLHSLFPQPRAPTAMASTVQLSGPQPKASAKTRQLLRSDACSRSESSLLASHPTSAHSGSIPCFRSLERLLRCPARCSCRSGSPKPAQKTRQLLRGERQPVGLGAPLSCICVLACHSVQECARICNNLRSCCLVECMRKNMVGIFAQLCS